jgi:hypothetical protein
MVGSLYEVMMIRREQILGVALVAGLIGLAPGAGAQQPAPAGGGQPDPVAALKLSIGEGTKKLAQYEWVETTIINLKGEEKGRKLNRCYYGADGKVQKIPLDQPAAKAEAPGGGRGGRRGGRIKEQIVEKKKDEMQDYMERAAALVHSYVPPSPSQIQAVKDGGRLSMTPQAGGTVRLEMKQYRKAGDALTIDLEPAANRLLGLGVNSYLDKPEDVVTLAVQMNTLPDGALYAAQTTLEAKARQIQVVVTNAGHKPVAR